MTKRIQLTATVFKNQFGQRLDKALAELLPNYSRSRIKEWILNQYVLVNGNIWNKPRKRVLGGEFISINASVRDNNYYEPQNIPLNIVYEDNDLIIINKPCNLVVHPGAGHLDGTILNALLYYYPPIANVPRAGIIHRLDKDTTGLMVVAKTVASQIRLIRLLQLHNIVREYVAIAIGHIATDGMVEKPISRHPTKRTHMSIHPTGKLAITYYQVIEHFRMHTLLRLRLETGRTHQIRIHMAHINHPLVGDQLYGSRYFQSLKGTSKEFIFSLRKFNRQALHAVTLRFCHPISGIKMEWHAPIPQDMRELIEVMRTDFKKYKIRATR